MKNPSFDHIHYRCTSFDEIRNFYVEIMGGIELPMIKLGGNDNMQIELGGVTLLFVESTDVIPISPDTLGVYHIAFLVDDCRKATAYFTKIKKAKIAKPRKRYSDTIVASFLAAPDGMMVELKEIKPRPKKKKK